MPRVTDGEIQTLTTIDEFEHNITIWAQQLGCDYISVEEDMEYHTIDVFTDLAAEERQVLFNKIRSKRHASVKVNVRDARHHDEHAEREVLTDVELYEVLGALPDNCSNGIDLDEVDILKLHPYIEKYGSFPELLDAIGKSVEMSHSGVESVDDDTSSSHQPEPETPQQSIERVCEEYVSGEIETVLELEDELETPVTKQLETEGLLV